MSTTTEAILSGQNIFKGFGSQPVLRGVSLTVHDGERLGLIGRNGCGKSTLLGILAGHDEPDEGLVTRRQGLRISLLNQDSVLAPEKSVKEVLEDAFEEVRALLAEHDRLAHRLGAGDTMDADIEEEYSRLHLRLEAAHAWDYEQEIKRIAVALKLSDEDRLVRTLSGGELRRLDLAAAILGHPDVLLLDEPTNHLDTESAEWIESFLAAYEGSCILVTHDRYFLDRVVTRIVELERNRIYSFPGNYEEFMEYKVRVKEDESRADKNKQGLLLQELEWFRRSPKARRTKSKARIKRLDELETRERPENLKGVYFEIPQGRRLGKRVLEVRDLSFAYGANVLFSGVSMDFQKGMRVGLVGPNGAGKTTFIRVLMELQDGYTGSVIVGESTEFLYVDQLHEDIDVNKTILDFVSGGAQYWEVDGRRIYVPSYLEKLLFDMETVRTPMSNLSGGERNRIELAKKLLKGGNFIVLDEPTNDLDLSTLRVLEQAVLTFEGCALIVSHDRYFLNRTCTHLIVFEGGGETVLVTGNYDDYLLFRERREKEHKVEAGHVHGPKKERKAAPQGERRLTYKEQTILEGMEVTVEEAEEAVKEIESRILEQGFYEGPHEEVRGVLEALEAAKARVEELYDTWNSLEQRSGIK